MSADKRRDVIVIGASAGGVEALRALVAGLPPDLSASLFVVLHLPRRGPSTLPSILDRSGPLPVDWAEHGQRPVYGHIYIAPPDHHLLLADGRMMLTHGPTENGYRPAVDPLFRSAAREYGPRVIGVVLSGSRDDGASGLSAVARRGGRCVVQEPRDALHAWMPRAALDLVPGCVVEPAARLGPTITGLVLDPPAEMGGVGQPDDLLAAEVRLAELGKVTTDLVEGSVPAGYGCPSCGGSLFELPADPGPGSGGAPRYRCRIGHAWSLDGLLDQQSSALEGALWTALRALEEKSALSKRMIRSMRARGVTASADRYELIAEENSQAGDIIRELIGSLDRLDP